MNKNCTSLYIIGNGFDLYHGIKSSYYNFREYVEKHDKELFDLVNEYLNIENNWSDFETALASLDIDNLLDHASSYLVPYSADKWSDAYHHDYQYTIEQVANQFSSKLKEHFSDWLCELSIPIRTKIYKCLLALQGNAIYLSFNYTSTLQSVYAIRESKILHIHGSLNKPQDIIVGHAWKPANNIYVDEPYDRYEVDTRILDGHDILEGYFKSTFKPTKKIIKKNRSFFCKLNTIRNIYVLGHSLSDVDIQYFKILTNKINRQKTQWIVSYYSQSDKVKFDIQFRKLKVPKKNIQYIKLNNLMRLYKRRKS